MEKNINQNLYEADLRTINEKLASADYQVCIEIANKMLSKLASLSLDLDQEQAVRVSCVTSIGDAEYGLRNYEQALDCYERARQLVEGNQGPLSEQAMIILFRIERTLAALATSGAPASVAAGGQEAGEEKLEELWKGRIESEGTKVDEKQKEVWQKNLRETVEFEPLEVSTAEKAQALLGKIAKLGPGRLIDISLALSMVLIISVGSYLFASSPHTIISSDNEGGDSLSLRCQRAGADRVTLKSADFQSTMTLPLDGPAEFSHENERVSLPLYIFDGNPGSACGLALNSWIRSSFWLQWNGVALEAEDGRTYYEPKQSEWQMVTRVHDLTDWATAYFRSHNKVYPGAEIKADKLLEYYNPLLSTTDKVLLADVSVDYCPLPELCQSAKIVPHPGLIVALRVLPAKNAFIIGAFDRRSKPMRVSTESDGYVILRDGRPATTKPYPKLLHGITLLDKPIDRFTLFLCRNGLLSWIFLFVLGAIGVRQAFRKQS